MTLDTYTQALSPQKRAAQSKVDKRNLPRKLIRASNTCKVKTSYLRYSAHAHTFAPDAECLRCTGTRRLDRCL
jgi:hypothetical protein